MKTMFLTIASLLGGSLRVAAQDSTLFRLHDVYGAVNNTYFLDYYDDTKGQFGFTGGLNFICYRMPFVRPTFFKRVDGLVGLEYNYLSLTKSPVPAGTTVYYTDMRYTAQLIAPTVGARLYMGKKSRWFLSSQLNFNFTLHTSMSGTVHSTAYDANSQPYAVSTPVSGKLDMDLFTVSAAIGFGTNIPIGSHALTLRADYNVFDYRGHPYDLGNQLKFSNLRVGVGFRF